jgi:hypothetical protein
MTMIEQKYERYNTNHGFTQNNILLAKYCVLYLIVIYYYWFMWLCFISEILRDISLLFYYLSFVYFFLFVVFVVLCFVHQMMIYRFWFLYYIMIYNILLYLLWFCLLLSLYNIYKITQIIFIVLVFFSLIFLFVI